MNEELQTVNQENRHKVEELGQLSGDLHNLFSSTDIATLFLDRELRIMRFTPKVSELFHVRATDRGRPLTDLTHRLGYPEIMADAARVLESLVPVEREVADEKGLWFQARLLPYRSSEDKIEGIVLTFVDITERKLQNNTLETKIKERTREVRQLARRLNQAEQQERQRVSQILHDDLQQILCGVETKLELIRETLEREQPSSHAFNHLRSGKEWLGEAIKVARRLTVELSPPVLENEGLVDALEWLRRQMKELHELDVTIEASGRCVIPDRDLRSLLFQSVRELLFNVKKHAKIDRARVELKENSEFTTICVTDEGAGMDLNKSNQESGTGGFGLFSIRERLRLLGGRVQIVSAPGKGTRVIVKVPLSASTAGDEADV